MPWSSPRATCAISTTDCLRPPRRRCASSLSQMSSSILAKGRPPVAVTPLLALGSMPPTHVSLSVVMRPSPRLTPQGGDREPTTCAVAAARGCRGPCLGGDRVGLGMHTGIALPEGGRRDADHRATHDLGVPPGHGPPVGGAPAGTP